jgi:NTE family protein
MKRKKIGLALSGGGARGWAHVGVIKALEAEGIKIDFIAGTSIGALVGGVHASGSLQALEEFGLTAKTTTTLSLIDLALSPRGLVSGKKLEKLLTSRFLRQKVENTKIPFTAVAVSIETGKEVHITKGNLFEAIRASIAIPGIFTPLQKGMDYLVDGGLTNPMPVDVVRKMGADIVIAVDLNHEVRSGTAKPTKWYMNLGRHIKRSPTMIDIVGNTINILQKKLTQSNLHIYPADIVIQPALGTIKLFDFHKAKEMIALGEKATEIAIRYFVF